MKKELFLFVFLSVFIILIDLGAQIRYTVVSFGLNQLLKDIDTYIRRKCQCVKQKRPNREDRALLVPIKSTYPFEIVSFNFLKVDKAKGDFEYVLVVTDHFT